MQFISHHSGSTGNLYQIKSEAGQLLIDPGVPIAKIKKALDFKLREIDACLCSHMHGDHSKAVHDIAESGIDVFCLAETAKALEFNGHRLNVIEPLHQFEIGKFSVLPFPLEHQDVRTGKRVPNVGFLISDGVKKLAYICDTFYVKNRFKDLDYLAIGINYSKKTMAPDLDPARKRRLWKSHFSLENAVKMIQSMDISKLKAIYVLHISETNGSKSYFKEVLQKKFGKPVYA